MEWEPGVPYKKLDVILMAKILSLPCPRLIMDSSVALIVLIRKSLLSQSKMYLGGSGSEERGSTFSEPLISSRISLRLKFSFLSSIMYGYHYEFWSVLNKLYTLRT